MGFKLNEKNAQKNNKKTFVIHSTPRKQIFVFNLKKW